MNEQTLRATFGGLLHDVGKLVYRAGEDARDHSASGYALLCGLLPGEQWRGTLDCVRYHHARALRQARVEPQSLAYIACIADNIAAAADRREIEGGSERVRFNRAQPLLSVFTHLNGEHEGLALEPSLHDGRLRLPGRASPVSAGEYAALLRVLRQGLGDVALSAEWVDSLLCLLESCTANVPSSTFTGESPDISLYDHLKITAAVSACISEYLLGQGETDYRARLLEHEAAFRAEPAFLMVTADLSGIQKFIYTVATSGAQRSLRSRSFFLEVLMEHYVDELLCTCGLSRANLIYSGGGHCYLLLPNTKAARDSAQAVNDRMNDWLIDQFGVRLFMAQGMTACSANELTNTPAEKAPYKEIFARLSSAVSQSKMRRVRAGQLRRLNSEAAGLDGRECTVCGSTDVLREGRCRWCARFEDISVRIQDESRVAYYVTGNSSGHWDVPLPVKEGEVYLSLMDERTARERLRTDTAVRRVYTKNRAFTGLRYSTRLDVCDYYASNQNEELANASAGISRLAVCRMDVDNLGHAFVAGFERRNQTASQERYRFVTLSRTAALSRQLSLFFKRHMREILTDGEPLQVSVVYSGGDDVFLLGAWNHVIDAALRIWQRFAGFTGGALTLSAGIALFDARYPIRLAAEETAVLEQRAKSEPGKDAVSLFDARQRHTYPWRVFANRVIDEKLNELTAFFSGQDERGMAFLYQMTNLLRAAEGDKLNLARYAYLLARLQPSRRSPSFALYERFSRQMYAWACSAEDRTQLITAIYLYVYMNRKAE
ncbi:MAG: type III-A CRISPR-associated protein Cas10/Csm1 [Clostridiales bacterium]|nr:type III-A CRISPR-associated protein Cas10/Csm1 [Clostridiales bacterium]